MGGERRVAGDLPSPGGGGSARLSPRRGGVKGMSTRSKPIDAFRRQTARRLRAHTTDAEDQLWRRLRRLPVSGSHFRRQVPIGPYVVDFACLAARLVVEVDGSQHASDENTARDAERTRLLEAEGYTVIRFWNNEISQNIDGVLAALYAAIHGSADAELRSLTHKRYSRPNADAGQITPPRRARQALRADPPPPGEDKSPRQGH